MKEMLKFELGLDRKFSDDLTHLYEYREIYSNVKNALGVFGACKRIISRWASPIHVTIINQMREELHIITGGILITDRGKLTL